MDDLRVTDTITIPATELVWRFSAAGGPGGQHANRSATRAELIFEIGSSTTFDAETKQRLLANLGGRAAGGIVTITERASRSQWRNRQRARKRLVELLNDAMRVEASRRPTRPSRAARRRRMDQKRRHSEKKRLRQPPDHE